LWKETDPREPDRHSEASWVGEKESWEKNQLVGRKRTRTKQGAMLKGRGGKKVELKRWPEKMKGIGPAFTRKASVQGSREGASFVTEKLQRLEVKKKR